jgi:hypothetical protein
LVRKIGPKNWSEKLGPKNWVRKIGPKNWSEKLVRKIGLKNWSENRFLEALLVWQEAETDGELKNCQKTLFSYTFSNILQFEVNLSTPNLK